MHYVADRIIRDEHLAISAVLYCLRALVRRTFAGSEPPNLPLLHAMLDYIVEFPDRWHHPKESQFLFRALRERDTSAGGLIDALEREHREGDRLIADLKRKLSAFENGEHQALPAFAESVEAYARMQWEHIRKEEDMLLPLAQRSLSADDWRRVAEAFQENDNPLFGVKPRDDAERLYRRILDLAAQPIKQRASARALEWRTARRRHAARR